MVLNIAFGEPTIAVDTHIFRVANRTGLAPGKTWPKSRTARGVAPDEFKLHAHHWLILHGRYVCVARKPNCPECIIRDLCEYQAQDAGCGDAAHRIERARCSIPRATKRAGS